MICFWDFDWASDDLEPAGYSELPRTSPICLLSKLSRFSYFDEIRDPFSFKRDWEYFMYWSAWYGDLLPSIFSILDLIISNKINGTLEIKYDFL